MNPQVLADSIQVLHVDDNEGFLDVSTELLRDDEIEVVTATSVEEGMEAVKERGIHCVVSDYDLPGEGGLEFLRRVREYDEDLPFILFTGEGSEEVASEAISMGVTDYVQKRSGTEHFDVLRNSVRNAVERYRAEHRLESMRDKYARVVEQDVFGVYIIQDGVIEYFNERCAEIFGYEPEELIGTSPLDLIVEEDHEEVSENLERRMAGEVESIHYDFRARRKDGEAVHVEVHGGRVVHDGEPAVMGVLHEVTERREREELYTTLVEEANDGVVIVQDGVIQFANKRIAEIVGVDQDEVLGETVFDYVAEDYVDRVVERFESREDETDRYGIDLVTTEGERVPVELNISSITYEGEPASVTVIRDVSDRKEREERVEMAYQMLNAVPDNVFAMDTEGRFIDSNEAAREKTGYSHDEATGEHVALVMDEEGLDKGLEAVQTLLEEDVDRVSYEHLVYPKEGDPYLGETTLALMTDKDGEVIGSVGVTRDIGDRKERERELERYESIVEASGEGMYVLDEEGVYEYINDAAADILGYEADEMLGDHVGEFLDDGAVERAEEVIEDLLEGDQWHETIELDLTTRDGREVVVENHIAVLEEDGEFRGTVGFVRDVTERVKRERELEWYENVMDASGDGMYALDREGRYVFVNERMAEVVGYDEDELLGENVSLLMEEEDIEKGRELIFELLESERNSANYEIEVETKDGEKIPIENNIALLQDEDGELMGTVGVARDISERKERQQELEWYETMIETSPDSMYVLDREGRYVFVNDHLLEALGYEEEELLGEHVQKILPEESIEKSEEVIRDILNSDEETSTYEMEVITKDGERTITENHLALLRDEDGEIMGSIGVTRNIEDRKEREEELRYERQLSDSIINQIPDVFYLFDEDGSFLRWNDELTRVSGYSDEEVEEMHPLDFFPEEYHEDVAEAMSRVMEGEEYVTVQAEVETKDGERIPYEFIGSPLYHPGGNLIGIGGIGRDISDMKERQRELEWHDRVLEASGDAVYALDPEGHYTFVNDAHEKLLGYSQKELEGEHVSKVMEEKDVGRGDELIRELLGSDRDVGTFEMGVETKDGEKLTLETSVALLWDEDGEFDGTVGVTRDVTERKEREQELEQYETFVQASGDGMYALDRQGRFTFVNDAILELTGYKEEEQLGEHASLVMPEEDVRQAEEIILDLLNDEDRGRATFEMDVITKDGRKVRVENHVALLSDEDGEFRGTVGVTRDITERVERERELEQYHTLVDTIGDPMYALDSQGFITMVNDAFVEQIGHSREDIVGEHALMLMRPEDLEEGDEIIKELLQDDDKKWGSLEMEIEDKYGNRRIYEDKIAVLKEDGEFVGSVGVIRDITERRRREQQLQVLDRVLRHNLRNDMNVILGYMEIIIDDVQDETLQKEARRVKETGNELVELSNKARYIEEILRSERDGKTSIDVVRLVNEQTEEFRDRYPDAEITVDAPEELMVFADKKLRIALRELLENAVVHNDESPEVSVKVSPSTAVGWVEIEVTDNGPGIPEQERSVLEKGEETPLSHGSGFGLWLVNWIVNESNGELEIRESEPRGSCVTIALPKEADDY